MSVCPSHKINLYRLSPSLHSKTLMAHPNSKRLGHTSSFGSNPDHHDVCQADQKRARTGSIQFASVVERVWEQHQLKKLHYAMEPMLRRVVSEEVERKLDHAITDGLVVQRRSPSFRIRAPEPTPPPIDIPLQLAFTKTLMDPIFTMNRILSSDGSPVQVLLTDPSIFTASAVPSTALPSPVKLEIVVLRGDFLAEGAWTAEEFDKNIVRAREGRRPLLIGDLTATLKPDDSSWELPVMTATFDQLQLTDNSRWVRSRKFRLGVRVVDNIPGSYYRGATRILEAVTEQFVVREQRGEIYKKHYPPNLEDEVWRLENIRRGGPLHQNLASAGIELVQDFLKMYIVDEERLRGIMGSKKNFKASVKHAMTCAEIGSKQYFFQANGDSIILDPICRVLGARIDGHLIQTTMTEPARLIHKARIDELVKAAYLEWDKVQEIKD